jgi:hypothetical protein
MTTVTVPPPDDAVHQDGVLMAQVSKLNEQLGRYVLRFLAADALDAKPMSPQAERLLAERVADLADDMRARAERRQRHGDPAPLVQRCLSDEQP